MKISIISILVQDQDQALDFYTKKLGFKKQEDINLGEHRWLTLTSPDGVEGVDLLLEPTDFSPAATYQKALYEAGIPATSFQTDDIQAEYATLKSRGVKFNSEPTESGPVTTVLFDDTCGNFICLAETTSDSDSQD